MFLRKHFTKIITVVGLLGLIGAPSIALATSFGNGSLGSGSGGGGASGTGTDNHIVRWDGTSALQDSSAVLGDDGSLTLAGYIASDFSNNGEILNYVANSRAATGTPATGSTATFGVYANDLAGVCAKNAYDGLNAELCMVGYGTSIASTSFGVTDADSVALTSSAASNGFKLGTEDATALILGTNNTARLTFGASGDATFSTRVGIGDSTPDADLDIFSSANAAIYVETTNVADGAGAGLCAFSTAGYGCLSMYGPNDTTAGNFFRDALVMAPGSTQAGGMALYSDTVPVRVGFKNAARTAAYETLRSTSDGASGAALVVNEQGESAVDFRVEGDTATHALFVDASADRVGINTSSPDYRLDIEGSGDERVVVTSSGQSAGTCGFAADGAMICSTAFSSAYTGYDSWLQTAATVFTSSTNGLRIWGDQVPVILGWKRLDRLMPYEGLRVTDYGTIVVNEQGSANTDLRVEGDTQTDLLLVDASADEVHIGGSTDLGAYTAQIHGSLRVHTASAGTITTITEGSNAGAATYIGAYNSAGGVDNYAYGVGSGSGVAGTYDTADTPSVLNRASSARIDLHGIASSAIRSIYDNSPLYILQEDKVRAVFEAAGPLVINPTGGTETDFAVDGDTIADLFLVDVSTQEVLIGGGTDQGTYMLQVFGKGLIVDGTGDPDVDLRVDTSNIANAFLVDASADSAQFNVPLGVGETLSATSFAGGGGLVSVDAAGTCTESVTGPNSGANNTRGTISATCTAGQTVILNWAAARDYAPLCYLTPENAAAAAVALPSVTASTTQMTVTIPAVTNGNWNYLCFE